MAAPLLQAQIDIDAPVAKVWTLVSDLSRMPQWSPQCRMMKALGPVRQGTRTINVNRRNRLFWPTTCTVTEVIPEKKLAFKVDINRTIWSYELEPNETGTRLVETRHAENGVTAFSNMSINALMGGVPSFERELVDGMNATLSRIKAAAKSWCPESIISWHLPNFARSCSCCGKVQVANTITAVSARSYGATPSQLLPMN
jgi:uncharacterized protein YndB with AHSA1/START domain